eukprot:3528507-Alexandrium_andersonii.AAC.1
MSRATFSSASAKACAPTSSAPSMTHAGSLGFLPMTSWQGLNPCLLRSSFFAALTWAIAILTSSGPST